MAAVGSETAEQKLAAVHQALRETRGLQFDFAAAPQPTRYELPDWLEALFRAIGPAMPYIFWTGVAVGALFLLYFLLRELAPDSWFRGRRATPAATDWRPSAEQGRALLDDADRLAAEGRFEEAIHVLLFRSIDHLVARRPGVVRPALTSRDIAGLEVLPPAARAAFARLAQAVERTFFGGRAASADEFGAARADYEAFAFAEGWR